MQEQMRTRRAHDCPMVQEGWCIIVKNSHLQHPAKLGGCVEKSGKDIQRNVYHRMKKAERHGDAMMGGTAAQR